MVAIGVLAVKNCIIGDIFRAVVAVHNLAARRAALVQRNYSA